MEPENSLPCSQEPAISPYAEPDEHSPHLTPYLFKINFNIILSSTNVYHKIKGNSVENELSWGGK
jgi:hypothetical protein